MRFNLDSLIESPYMAMRPTPIPNPKMPPNAVITATRAMINGQPSQ
jgi:hypothetical protein